MFVPLWTNNAHDEMPFDTNFRKKRYKFCLFRDLKKYIETVLTGLGNMRLGMTHSRIKSSLNFLILFFGLHVLFWV